MAKKNNPYFDDFMAMIECSCRAAEHLQDTLNNFNPKELKEKCKVMHEIENQGDDMKREMLKRLTKEFIPPIDREDIIEMSNELDNVTDKIEDIMMHVYIYNIRKIHPDALIYTEIIGRYCNALQKAVMEFPRFRKSTILEEMIVEINLIEEEGDRLYLKAVRELFKNETNPVEIIVWSKILDLMEDCCDTCKHVSNVMEQVMMKNA